MDALALANAIMAARVAAERPPPPPGRPPRRQGGCHQVRPFDTTDGVEWATWRQTFQLTAAANGWSDLRRRQEIAASMLGVAHRAVCDINPNPATPAGAAAFTAENLLDQYQARFLPVAPGPMAQIMFKAAHQAEAENALQWHARVRTLYARAYPDRGGEDSAELINQFILGLAHEHVRGYTWEQRPTTYALALAAAYHEAAGRQGQVAEEIRASVSHGTIWTSVSNGTAPRHLSPISAAIAPGGPTPVAPTPDLPPLTLMPAMRKRAAAPEAPEN